MSKVSGQAQATVTLLRGHQSRLWLPRVAIQDPEGKDNQFLWQSGLQSPGGLRDPPRALLPLGVAGALGRTIPQAPSTVLW